MSAPQETEESPALRRCRLESAESLPSWFGASTTFVTNRVSSCSYGIALASIALLLAALRKLAEKHGMDAEDVERYKRHFDEVDSEGEGQHDSKNQETSKSDPKPNRLRS
eukprot:2996687-Amphidinium_carterae.2